MPHWGGVCFKEGKAVFIRAIRLLLLGAIITALGVSGVDAADDVIFSDRFKEIDGYVVTVVIQGDGDASPSRRTVPANATLTITVKPGEGHGVATVSGCNGNLDGFVYETGPITADCSVTVNFLPNQYTLTFDSAGGSAVDPIEQDFGTEITPPTDPTLDGYTFTGWLPSLPSTMPAEDLTLTAQWEQTKFELGDNGVTIVCPLASVGESGTVDGVTYTRRTKDQITPGNAANTCTSGMSDFSGLFVNKPDFNDDIGHWDVSQGTKFNAMFQSATLFNQDLSHWDTTQATNMDYMFYKASAFNQDLSSWCVENISSPFLFSESSAMSVDDEPSFGTPCD